MSEDNTQDLGQQILQRLDAIDSRLAALEAKAYDTRPIWEKALAEIMELKDRLVAIDRQLDRQSSKVDIFIEEVVEMRRSLRTR